MSELLDAGFDTSQCLIGGRWIGASGGKTLPVEDPSTGLEIGRIARGGKAEIEAAVDAAQSALAGEWGRMPAAERGRLLAKIGRAVEENVEWLANLEAHDVGKPLTQARADARALARYLEFYGGAADKIHGETIPYLNDYTVYTLREPHGVTGHIIPWNYPMQILGRSVGAALTMGNAAVLKPAEEASLTALAFARIAMECGLPAGALNVVPGLGEEAGAALCSHPGVNHISFTGSLETGRKIQQAAAQNVIPVTLELGGKSPQIVFADADLERALPFLVNAGIQNAGQTCSASSRILVEASLHKDLVRLMSERYKALTVGAAIEDQSVGPLISARQKNIVQGFLAEADEDGLAPVAEGQMPKSAPMGGHYVRPTLYGDVDPAMRWPATRFSARCRSSSRSATRKKPSQSPTAPITDWWPVSGPGMAVGRCGWRAKSAPARSSSTITAPAAASNCLSAASANPATAAKRVLRRSTASRR